MFKCAIFSFQIPILTTLIQPPLKASTTPWILTACCERPSIAWEGNEHHCTGWLQREGFAIPHCCFCSLNTRLQTFYTLCKWKEYMWMIKFYVYEGIYVYICKQSLHEPSCCKSRGETLPVGITSEVAHTTLVDYTDPCAAWGSERDTNLHQSSLHTPHHPRHFERGKVQLVQSVFIVWSLFLWAFSVPFLIWCLDVVLH